MFKTPIPVLIYLVPQGAGIVILTLLGGFHLQTQSSWLIDIALHHIAILCIFLVAGHMYSSIELTLEMDTDLSEAHIP